MFPLFLSSKNCYHFTVTLESLAVLLLTFLSYCASNNDYFHTSLEIATQHYKAYAQDDINTTMATNNYLPYENITSGVRINYPADWKQLGSFGDMFIAVFQHPADTSDGRPVVNLMSNPTDDKDMTPEEYVDTFVKSNTQSGAKKIILTDGTPAYKTISTYQISPGVTGKMLEVGTVNNGKIISIVYDAEEPEFPKYLPIVEEMISSFQIIDSSSLQSLPTTTPTPTQSPSQSQSQPPAEYSVPPNP